MRKHKGTEDDGDVVIIPREMLRHFGRKRWNGVSTQERKKITSAAGKTSWANVTPEERSREMKRRAAVREWNRAMKRDNDV